MLFFINFSFNMSHSRFLSSQKTAQQPPAAKLSYQALRERLRQLHSTMKASMHGRMHCELGMETEYLCSAR